MPETKKLLAGTKSKIIKDKNGTNVLHSKITEVVLDHCNIVKHDHQLDSIDLYTFAPNKSCGQLVYKSSKIILFLKTFNSEFSYIKAWSTDQNLKVNIN